MILTTEENLAAWHLLAAGDRSIIAAGRGYGFPEPQDLSGKTGAQIIDGMMRGRIPIAPQANALQFFIVERDDKKVVFQGSPSVNDLNPMGLVSGGWITTLMDSAMGSSVLNGLPEGKSYVTKELKVEFVAGLDYRKVPIVRVDADTDFETGKLAYAKAVMYGPDENIIYARATCICRVFSVPTL